MTSGGRTRTAGGPTTTSGRISSLTRSCRSPPRPSPTGTIHPVVVIRVTTPAKNRIFFIFNLFGFLEQRYAVGWDFTMGYNPASHPQRVCRPIVSWNHDLFGALMVIAEATAAGASYFMGGTSSHLDAGSGGRMGVSAAIMAFCTVGLERFPRWPPLREDRQLLRAKCGVKPGQVRVRQQKIVLIDDDADVGVGAQAGVIGPQIAGLFQRLPPVMPCPGPDNKESQTSQNNPGRNTGGFPDTPGRAGNSGSGAAGRPGCFAAGC